MATTQPMSIPQLRARRPRLTNLTCSLVSSVVPAASSHFPRKSSPRKGFSGFFSLPYCSLRLAYCCFRVVKNHFKTRSALLAGSDSAAGAAKTDGCSHQYELNSVRLVDERMKGGAVRLARSPLKDAMDCQVTCIVSDPDSKCLTFAWANLEK